MIYLELFLEFLRIGAFSFGGGSAMLPMIEQTMERTGWMTREQLFNFFGISESTPGPIAVNLSTYIGARLAGFWGAFAATLGVILPSFLIILIVARAYLKFRKNRYVSGTMGILRPVVVGMLATAVFSVLRNVFDLKLSFLTGRNLISLLSVAAAGVMAYLKVHPILIICVCAGLSILLSILM